MTLYLQSQRRSSYRWVGWTFHAVLPPITPPLDRFREESSQLLSCLIQSLPRLALLFVDPLMKGLLERLGALASSLRQFRAAAQGLPSGGTAASAIAASKLLSRRSKEFGVLTSVLVTLGDLCRVAGTAVRPYVSDTLPLVIDCLQENAAGNKREVRAYVSEGFYKGIHPPLFHG